VHAWGCSRCTPGAGAGALQRLGPHQWTPAPTCRNLDFFTSFYRFLIQLLPAAVVAPLYFRYCMASCCARMLGVQQLPTSTSCGAHGWLLPALLRAWRRACAAPWARGLRACTGTRRLQASRQAAHRLAVLSALQLCLLCCGCAECVAAALHCTARGMGPKLCCPCARALSPVGRLSLV
jgi:hypothetical protein